jgi:hypothetical protein
MTSEEQFFYDYVHATEFSTFTIREGDLKTYMTLIMPSLSSSESPSVTITPNNVHELLHYKTALKVISEHAARTYLLHLFMKSTLKQPLTNEEKQLFEDDDLLTRKQIKQLRRLYPQTQL